MLVEVYKLELCTIARCRYDVDDPGEQHGMGEEEP